MKRMPGSLMIRQAISVMVRAMATMAFFVPRRRAMRR
jgi:hypothetical protein